MRTHCIYSRAISVLVAVALFSGLCLAQTKPAGDAILEIVVKDPSGALVDNARVQLIRNGKPANPVQTNQKGEARLDRVAAARYQLHVEAIGFKPRDVDTCDMHPGFSRMCVSLKSDPVDA